MRNFIWDFDGTLFDTYTHTVSILHQIMEEAGKHCDYNVLFAVILSIGRMCSKSI